MKAFAILSSVISISAGLYLLSTQAAADNSFFEVIAHGMGIYFIAKGLYLGPSLMRQDAAAHALEFLARQQEGQRKDESFEEYEARTGG